MMKHIIFLLVLFAGYCSTAQVITSDKSGQLWNVSNGYYGTINANTVDAYIALDSVKNTTSYLYIAEWPRLGRYLFDSARILAKNTSGSGPYYLPYSQGLKGRGTLSITADVLKASTTSTVTPTVVITPEQSPNGISSWVAIPGVTAATVSPSSRTVIASTTFNILDTYQQYLRLKIASTDTCSIKSSYDFKPKTY